MHPLDPIGQPELARLDHHPDSAGALVYRGAVFAQQGHAAAPLFSYERRVADGATASTAAHITRDPQGRVIIVERATFGAGYALQHVTASNLQQGWRGSATVSADGRRLDFVHEARWRRRTASEAVTLPLVSGPSLHGFILQHAERLAAGQALPVRLVVLAKRASYAFVIRQQAEQDGCIVYTVTPSRWWMRLAVAPLRLFVHARTRHIVRYEGRVPPMQARGRRLVALDARVDYVMTLPAYR